VARPAVLLSVGHGLGAPRRGWRSAEEQRRRQGALVVAPEEVVDAERLRGRPFLPGGLWLYFACFGAGTPATSAYHTWLSSLAEEGAFHGDLAAVLRSLPEEGRRPFIGALPAAALANPEGPLAVIGHVDLAWSHSFSEAREPGTGKKSRLHRVLEQMIRGGRAGEALDVLMESYREANNDLTMDYEDEENARRAGKPDPTDRAARAHLWMLRNDLRGYVLLGDPAARLAREGQAESGARAPEVAAAFGREEAVAAMLRGDEAPQRIAARAGMPLDALWDWVEAHRAAARAKRAQG
jgi:hypothetical protein